MSDDQVKINIPERHQEFCKAVARLCREHGLIKANMSYSPAFEDDWDGEIQMSWEDGRHGEDSDKLFLSSTLRVWTRLGKGK